MATDARALLLTIQANTELLRSNLSEAEKSIGAFTGHTEEKLSLVDRAFEHVGERVKESALEIGAGIVGIFELEKLGEAIEKGLEYAAALGEVAEQLGVTARDLQVFRYAASQVGVQTDEMDKGLQKFTRSLGEARAGSAEAAKIFHALGFSQGDIAHLDVHDALLKTAQGISEVGDRASRAVPETQLFGRAGQQLDPLLSQGAKGIEAFATQAEKLGLIIPDEFLERAAKAEHTVSELKQVLSVDIASVVAENANAITIFAHALEAAAAGAGHLIERIEGFSKIRQEEGVLSAFAATAKDKEEAATPEGFVARERRLYQDARQSYHANPTSPDQLAHYRDAVQRFRVAVEDLQRSRAEEAAAEKLGQGSTIGDVLAPKGPKGKTAAEIAKEAEEARKREVERQKRVADQQAHLDDEALAQRASLTANIDEQAVIARQRLAAETKAALDDVAAGVSDGRIKEAEAEGLRAAIERNAALKVDGINQRENVQHEQADFALANAQLDALRDILGSQEALARTTAERRRLALDILAAEKEAERKRLRTISDDKYRPQGERHHSDEQIQEADLDLSTLDTRYALKGEDAKRQNASPLDAYHDQLKGAVGDVHDDLQSLEVSAIGHIGDAFADATTKALHLHGVLGGIVGDFIKLAEQELELKLVDGLLGAGGAGGGGFFGKLLKGFGGGHADGGSVDSSKFYLVGERGPELFAPTGSGTIIPNHQIRAATVPDAAKIGSGRQAAIAPQLHFDLRGAVMTQDLLNQMNANAHAIVIANAPHTAAAGARLADANLRRAQSRHLGS
jgi:uncharacterized spore protein YtfJ